MAGRRLAWAKPNHLDSVNEEVKSHLAQNIVYNLVGLLLELRLNPRGKRLALKMAVS